MFERMFENIGARMKSIGKVLFYVVLVATIGVLIIGLIIVITGKNGSIELSGAPIYLLASLLTYGLGELIENSQKTLKILEEMKKEKFKG